MKNDDVVVFKGTREGLWLVLDDQIDYPMLLDRLREKLKQTTDFFAGAKVIVNPGKREMRPTHYHGIADVLQKEYGLVLLRWDINGNEPKAVQESEEATHSSVDNDKSPETLIIYRTVRSGQQINHEGSVLVLGDVNPGAAIIAGGDITILGVCRGTVHAGSAGNSRALIAAYRLQAKQLRIANIVVCAPDDEYPPECPEIAYIKDGEVVIEATNLR